MESGSTQDTQTKLPQSKDNAHGKVPSHYIKRIELTFFSGLFTSGRKAQIGSQMWRRSTTRQTRIFELYTLHNRKCLQESDQNHAANNRGKLTSTRRRYRKGDAQLVDSIGAELKTLVEIMLLNLRPADLLLSIFILYTMYLW